MSPDQFSGNLFDQGSLSSVLAKIAKIDRLPTENSLGGLNALSYAWDTVDICNYVANQMKIVTKVEFSYYSISSMI